MLFFCICLEMADVPRKARVRTISLEHVVDVYGSMGFGSDEEGARSDPEMATPDLQPVEELATESGECLTNVAAAADSSAHSLTSPDSGVVEEPSPLDEEVRQSLIEQDSVGTEKMELSEHLPSADASFPDERQRRLANETRRASSGDDATSGEGVRNVSGKSRIIQRGVLFTLDLED